MMQELLRTWRIDRVVTDAMLESMRAEAKALLAIADALALVEPDRRSATLLAGALMSCPAAEKLELRCGDCGEPPTVASDPGDRCQRKDESGLPCGEVYYPKAAGEWGFRKARRG